MFPVARGVLITVSLFTLLSTPRVFLCVPQGPAQPLQNLPVTIEAECPGPLNTNSRSTAPRTEINWGCLVSMGQRLRSLQAPEQRGQRHPLLYLLPGAEVGSAATLGGSKWWGAQRMGWGKGRGCGVLGGGAPQRPLAV